MIRNTTELLEVYRKKLSGDRVFAGLTEEEQTRLIETALESGRDMARTVAEEIRPLNYEGIARWLERNGISVERLETKYQLPYIAEYEERKHRINLYTARIEDLQQTVSRKNAAYFEAHSLEEMCLLHESFHHLESSRNRTTGRIIGTGKKLFGFLPVTHYYAEGSEIAAHEFVGELLSLPFTTYTLVDEAVAIWKEEKENRKCQQNTDAQ